MWQQLIQLIFPTKCLMCDRQGLAICSRCIKQIPLSVQPRGAPFLYALYDYNHPLVARAIKSLKYHHREALARALSIHGRDHLVELLSTLLQTTTPISIVLVPIPQHRSRSWERGFNPSQLIATWLALTLPFVTTKRLLRKHRATEAQAQLKNKKQRLENMINSMQSKPCDPTSYYVIIDDVITTGATATEARRALVKAGATKVIAFGLAHSGKSY